VVKAGIHFNIDTRTIDDWAISAEQAPLNDK